MSIAEVQLGAFFRSSFRDVIEEARDKALIEGARILRQEDESSIRQRWYKLGRTLRSLQEQFTVEGDRKGYELGPTTFYAIFGEYGTGRRGATTGEPAPRGWKYGDKPGMAARRYSRIAVAVARPKVTEVFRSQIRTLAANLTV